MGAGIPHSQLVYTHSGDHGGNQSIPFTAAQSSQEVPAFYMTGTQHRGFEPITEAGTHRLSGHSGHLGRSGFDDPVDLSSGKVLNGLIKQEHPHGDERGGPVYTQHNGIHVGMVHDTGTPFTAYFQLHTEYIKYNFATINQCL